MSIPQVQHKASLANGVNRRQGNLDLENGPESFRNDYQSNRHFRSGSGNHRIEGVGHQHTSYASSIASISQAGSLLKDKAEALAGGESREGDQGLLNEHLMHLTACLIGHPVEVQVKCGSIYSGVFHTGNAGKDHGIVLKMARLIKDGYSKGKNNLGKDTAIRPQKKYIIYAKDLVQIIAKDVPLRAETLQNGWVRENRAEIATDAILSHGRQGDLERELKPWTPDAVAPQDLGLEATFENTWHRNWDQFEINRTLFGVESTFHEELYTTKLEKGPQMREREREASRIAREIEGQSSKNLYSAEERGVRLTKEFELLDEESRFSSVLRSIEDAGEDMEDVNVDANNAEMFDKANNQTVADSTNCGKKVCDAGTSMPTRTDLKKDSIPASAGMNVATVDGLDNVHKEKSHVMVGDRTKHGIGVAGFTSPLASSMIGDTTSLHALNLDPGSPHITEDVYRDFNEYRQQENAKRGKQHREDQVNELKSFSKSLKELTVGRQHTTRKTAAACAPPASALPLPTSITNPINSHVEFVDIGVVSVTHSTPSNRAAESARITNNEVSLILGLSQTEQLSTSATCSTSIQSREMSLSPATPTTLPSSPSSCSETSSSTNFTKKSTLNPHAKEFKLNPKAKSFTPNCTPLRPPSPGVQGSLYIPGMLPPVGTQMPIGAGPPAQQAGQPTAKYTQFNNVHIGGASSGTSFLATPGTYAPVVSGGTIPPGGQVTMKGHPHLQVPAVGPSYGSQQPFRYPSQAPVVQPAPTYLHPSSHLYPQQMMFGPQPGQVFYFPSFPQGPPLPPPLPSSAAAQQMQTNPRGQEMQMCVGPTFVPGQQHFLPQVQMPQFSSHMQRIPGALPPPTLPPPSIQPPQGVAAGMVPQTSPTSA